MVDESSNDWEVRVWYYWNTLDQFPVYQIEVREHRYSEINEWFYYFLGAHLQPHLDNKSLCFFKRNEDSELLAEYQQADQEMLVRLVVGVVLQKQSEVLA